MLEITVLTERGKRRTHLSAEELAGLVRHIGDDGDNFLVVQRTPVHPYVFVQVWHANGGTYTLEHRDGDTYAHTELDGPEAAIGAMTGWARQEADWDAGLSWSPLDV